MTLKGGEFGVGLLLPLLEEVDSNPFILICPVLVGFFPCWRALYRGKGGGVDHNMSLYCYILEHVLLSIVKLKIMILPRSASGSSVQVDHWNNIQVICKPLYTHATHNIIATVKKKKTSLVYDFMCTNLL